MNVEFLWRSLWVCWQSKSCLMISSERRRKWFLIHLCVICVKGKVASLNYFLHSPSNFARLSLYYFDHGDSNHKEGLFERAVSSSASELTNSLNILLATLMVNGAAFSSNFFTHGFKNFLLWLYIPTATLLHPDASIPLHIQTRSRPGSMRAWKLLENNQLANFDGFFHYRALQDYIVISSCVTFDANKFTIEHFILNSIDLIDPKRKKQRQD